MTNNQAAPELLPSPLPWNFDNGAYLKDANGKTIADFRYKNAKADVKLILDALTRAAQPQAPNINQGTFKITYVNHEGVEIPQPSKPNCAELEARVKKRWLELKPTKEAQNIRASVSNLDDDEELPDVVWELMDIAAQSAFNEAVRSHLAAPTTRQATDRGLITKIDEAALQFALDHFYEKKDGAPTNRILLKEVISAYLSAVKPPHAASMKGK